MGVSEIFLQYLDGKGIFDGPGIRVMDIGAQNYYLGTSDYVQDFVGRHGGADKGDDIAAFAAEMQAGGIAEDGGFRNDAFLGDLLVRAGIDYTSLDVFERPRNIVADLNHFMVPDDLRQRYDVVLNFGTTEHILNQYNCFKVIHELCKVDGWIFHQVPVLGLIDHGYFTYSPVFFIALAQMNRYRVEEMWFSGPGKETGFFEPMRIEPEGARLPDLPRNDVERWEAVRVPGGVVNVLLRRMKRAQFRAPLELSTAVAEAAEAVSHAKLPASVAEAKSKDLIRELVNRFKTRIGLG